MQNIPSPSRVERILVATDFSPTATGAFDWAVEVAKTRGARIELVHAIELTGVETLALELQEAVTRSLDVLVRSAERQGVRASSMWRRGRPWDIVGEVQQERGCDLIVVGARGHTIYAPPLLGSRADRIVRTAPVPVVTVHPNDHDRPLNTVLVATDFSEEAALATSAAVRLLTGATEAHLVLLHVTQNLVPYEYFRAGGIGPTADPAAVERAETYLAGLAGPLQSDRMQVTTMVREGYPAAIIEDEARAADADLIALGTRGRGGLKRLLLGSIAERVLHHARCPVLTVRHPDTSEPVKVAEEHATV